MTSACDQSVSARGLDRPSCSEHTFCVVYCKGIAREVQWLLRERG